MDYNQAIEYIYTTSLRGSKLGLSRVKKLLEILENPQNDLRIIHVAGTNGKGSVCAMLKSILSCAGYRVGLFTSPPLTKKNECYSINDTFITDTEYAKLVSYVSARAEKMSDLPTEFEIETAMALKYFAYEKCDIVILETGMGGKLDATNISDAPILSVITDISADHQSFLGSTIEEIAHHKCGIIKSTCPVVFGGDNKIAESIVIDTANERSAPLTIVDYGRLQNIVYGSATEFQFDTQKFCINLLGSYQPRNAAIALTAVDVLRDSHNLKISYENIKSGLLKANWKGRFELLSQSPLIIYDGAHNLGGMNQAVRSVKQYFGAMTAVNVLMGVMADKEYGKMVKLLAGITNSAFTVSPNNPRALSAESLRACFESHSVPAASFDTISDAVKTAVFYSQQNETPLLILGTLYMYADILSGLENLGIPKN